MSGEGNFEWLTCSGFIGVQCSWLGHLIIESNARLHLAAYFWPLRDKIVGRAAHEGESNSSTLLTTKKNQYLYMSYENRPFILSLSCSETTIQFVKPPYRKQVRDRAHPSPIQASLAD
jgi:hypothetical protein